MAQGSFVTAINCMDGRVQEPVIRWMKRRLHADYVDMITEPGPDKVMTAGPESGLESIRHRVSASIGAHHSRTVAMVAHHDCGGFPVSKERHLAALEKCIDIIRSWELPVSILGLWVNEDWQVEVIHDAQAGAA